MYLLSWDDYFIIPTICERFQLREVIWALMEDGTLQQQAVVPYDLNMSHQE